MITGLITSDTLVFFKAKLADIKFIMGIENEDDNKKYIIPYSRKRHVQEIKNRNNLYIIIQSKQISKPLGFIILSGIKDENKSIEFKRIVIAVKNKGYGKESIKLIKDFCFKKLKCHKLWLDVFDDNERAINLYKSQNFTLDGKLRDCIKQGDKFRSLLLFSILEKEFIASQ